MASRNIFAFTPSEPIYPAYISVNYPFDGRGGGEFTSTDIIEVTVRSPARQMPDHYPVCGDMALIALDRKQARELGLALVKATDE